MQKSPANNHGTGRGEVKATIILVCLVFLNAEASQAQRVGNCEAAAATSILDANNVFTTVHPGGAVVVFLPPTNYQVPRFTNLSTVFAGTFSVFGKSGETLRGAGATYGNFEFWPGPLEDDGASPTDCVEYDRIYKVTQSDIDTYESVGLASVDLRSWPTGLGAPTVDASGNLVRVLHLPLDQRRDRVIDLQSGERPSIAGTQSLWWIMQDMGNEHERTKLQPLGIEVHVRVSAAPSLNESIGNSSLWEYRIINKSSFRIDSTYIGLWFDMDLGFPWDDFVGSDSLRNLGYVYNADNQDDDDSRYGYLDKPPAVGIRILQSPLADSDGLDNNYDGRIDETDERLGMTSFMPIYKNDFVRADPREGEDYFLNFQSRWHDGRPLREGGNGYDSDGKRVKFGFPGDPVKGEFWTEENTDGSGGRGGDRDRRFMMSTGPFTLEPGAETEFAFAIVWALGTDRLDSITKMKQASDDVRDAFTLGFTGFPNGPLPEDTVELFSPASGAAGLPVELDLRWAEVSNVSGYQIALTHLGVTTYRQTQAIRLEIRDLTFGGEYSWKVRPVNQYGSGPWSEENIFSTGFVEFDIARPFISEISTVNNAAGRLSPVDLASSMYVGPCPLNPDEECLLPTPNYQQSTSGLTWLLEFGSEYKSMGPITDRNSRLGSLTNAGKNLEAFTGYDFQIRFTSNRGKASILDDPSTLIDVPFELWNVGRSDVTDTSDDFRLIPVICESACGAGSLDGRFEISDDKSDRIFWYEPLDVSPGTTGYWTFVNGDRRLGREVLADTYLKRIQVQAPNQRFDNSNSPEPGTVIRIKSSPGFTPILSSPENGAIFGPGPRGLYWEGSDRDVYSVQISSDGNFDHISVETIRTSDGFTTVDLARGRYFWRVVGYSPAISEVRTFEIASVADEIDTAGSFKLFGNYPNPFSGITTIGYDVGKSTILSLFVYDILGRLVDQKRLSSPATGYQTVQFDASGLAAGTYLYRITDGTRAESKMMIVVR